MRKTTAFLIVLSFLSIPVMGHINTSADTDAQPVSGVSFQEIELADAMTKALEFASERTKAGYERTLKKIKEGR